MNADARIYVTGHGGLAGSAIIRKLQKAGYANLLTRASSVLDLRDQVAVREMFATEKPQYVFHAAGKVGGIHANNTYPADFLYDNLIMAANVIHAAYCSGVTKLLFLGSTCIYPKMAPQPLREDYLLTGPLEPTNEGDAIAKMSGIKLCQAYRQQHGCDFIAAMPTNLYGPGDNFDLENSHVLPALIRKFHEAKVRGDSTVTIWGSGRPLREFCHVDDCADACVFLMNNYSDEQIVNIGVGSDISIMGLAELVKNIVGFEGDIQLDISKPDGTPRKLVDTGRINALGWKPGIDLESGIQATYDWFLKEEASVRR